MTSKRRRTGSRTLLAAVLAAVPAAILAPAAAQAAFECPVRAPAPTHPLPGDLAQDVKPYDDPRADPALRADVRSMVDEGMPRGEVVDHVVAAYCPAIDAVPGLSDAQKESLVQRFASHVAQAVYAPANAAVEDVLVDVPVPTDLYARVKEAADQHHESQDAFMLAALRKAAGTP